MDRNTRDFISVIVAFFVVLGMCVVYFLTYDIARRKAYLDVESIYENKVLERTYELDRRLKRYEKEFGYLE